jgi:hypothetical protein
MARGPTVPVETCLRCGDETAQSEADELRHRLQLVDTPRGDGDATVVWGRLCPVCWARLRRFVTGRSSTTAAATSGIVD